MLASLNAVLSLVAQPSLPAHRVTGIVPARTSVDVQMINLFGNNGVAPAPPPHKTHHNVVSVCCPCCVCHVVGGEPPPAYSVLSRSDR